MTRMNKFFGLVLAFAFVAFALPVSAAQPPTKQYSLDITQSYPAPAVPPNHPALSFGAAGGTVYWTIKNETPTGGNSAIGSFKIKQKLAGVVIDLSSAQGVSGAASFALDPVNGDLLVSGFTPLVPKQDNGTHSLTISFKVQAVDPCTLRNVDWSQPTPLLVTVHTGNFSNTTFGYIDIAEYNQETDFAQGTCYQVTGVASPSAGGTVACNPAKVLPGSQSTCTSTANANYFPTGFSGSPIACVQIGTTNKCTVSMPILNPQDTITTGFFSQSSGKVGCISGGPLNPGTTNNWDTSLTDKTDFSYDPDKSNVPFADGWGLRRGANKDGALCVLVDYAFTPAVSGDGSSVASLLFDQTSGQKASWKYLIVWPDPVASTQVFQGWTSFRPSVSWGIANPTPNTTDFVPALFCAGNVADVDITTLSPAQLAALLPVIPEDGVGGPFHESPNAQFKPGQTAKVCVVRNGVTTDASNTLFPFTEVLDEADAYLTPR